MSYDAKHLLIPKIENGTVIDHIPAGLGVAILEILQAHDDLNEITTAVGLNLSSSKMGRKDMIKLWQAELSEHLVQHLSLIAPGATIKRVRDFQVDKRYVVSLPALLDNLVRCLNPNCMTNVEKAVRTRFCRVDEERRLYRCAYCERVFRLQHLEPILPAPRPSAVTELA
ncbi:MAG: aspartate carbamoyltransferase regulatory subunit [Pseudomonadota bacterium]